MVLHVKIFIRHCESQPRICGETNPVNTFLLLLIGTPLRLQGKLYMYYNTPIFICQYYFTTFNIIFIKINTHQKYSHPLKSARAIAKLNVPYYSPIFLLCPLPVHYLRQILTVISYVLLVHYKLVSHKLIYICALVSKLRKHIYNIDYYMESVNLILHSHIERSGYRSLFTVTAYEQILILTMIKQLMDERRISMECEYYRLILCKQRIKFNIAESVRMLGLRLKLHKIHHIYESYLYIRKLLPEYCNRCQRLERRRISAAGKHYIRLLALVV